MRRNVALLGLGPHAKRIYINLFKKNSIIPKLIVDLEQNQDEIRDYLKNNFDSNISCYFVKNEEADLNELSEKVKKELKKIIKELQINYAIISTEPKAHFAYSKFLIDNDINILMDKPITSPINAINNILSAKKVEEEYLYLCNQYIPKKEKINFMIQCQRRFHAGYNFVKDILLNVVSKYQVPITYIDIYHSDGMWNMPNEFFTRENHPYKYGYGKLFHSGYHFIDLLTWLMECNDSLNKNINNVSLYATTFRPYDFLHTVNNDFYKRVFNTSKYDEIYDHPETVKDFGELDIHAMIDFKSDDKIVTNCSLNLMQSGFSKRAWIELPKDTYKSNGRVRHERVNIQVGPLLNIQIHSYQSKEINDICNDSPYSVGSIDHFDIYIFRNTKLIGGKSFEKVSIHDLLAQAEKFLGNNEKAREICFLKFLNNENNSSNILSHQKSILLLSKLCESIATKKNYVSFDWRDYYEK